MLRHSLPTWSTRSFYQILTQPRSNAGVKKNSLHHLYSLPSASSYRSVSRLPLRNSLYLQRASYSTVVVQNTSKPSRLPRILFFSLISLGTFTLSFFFGLDNFFPLPFPFMGSMPTDQETLSLFEAQDETTREINEHIKNHPLAVKLRNDPNYIESRPHMKVPQEIRGHNLTAGTLQGPDKIVVPPLYFNDHSTHTLVSIFYLGSDVSGHPGIVHGGMLATLLDEGLARCAFPALPNKVGVTAMLNIEYKKPAMTGTFFVLRANTTKVEGRKAFTDGHIETLVGEGEEPEILVSAKALFIEPKGAKALTSLYKVS